MPILHCNEATFKCEMDAADYRRIRRMGEGQEGQREQQVYDNVDRIQSTRLGRVCTWVSGFWFKDVRDHSKSFVFAP